MWANWFEVCITLYLRSLFNLTKINPLETGGHDKILHTFQVSIRTLQMLPLILENSTFPCIIAIFLNKILSEIKTLSNFFKTL